MISVAYYNDKLHFEKLMDMNLRDADSQEMLASTGLNVQDGLAEAVALSNLVCYVYLDDKKDIIAVSGASMSGYPDVAIVWAMATNEVFAYWDEVEPLFNKHVNGVLDFQGVEVIANIIDLRNKAHIRWIQKLGFTMSGNIIELRGFKFESFYKRKT